MKTKEDIIEYFNDLEETKRLKELEGYIENNKKINQTLEELKALQRKMIVTKQSNKFNEFKLLEREYENKKEEFLSLPFVEEYIELREIIDNELKSFKEIVEENINNIIN